MRHLWLLIMLCALAAGAPASDDMAAGTEGTVASVTQSARIYTPARTLERTAPRYPRGELERGREAWIQLTYCIDESGSPQNISVLDSAGSEAFERAAIAAASKWRFDPAVVDGEPVWQSGNRAVISFVLEGRPDGATRKFLRKYNRLGELIDEGEFEAAEQLFDELLASDGMNLYELSKLWAQRAKLELARKDLDQLDLALHRATISNGDHIEKDSYIGLLAIRVRVELELGAYATAIRTYEKLLEEAGDESAHVVALRPHVDRLRDLISGDKILTTPARIDRKEGCHTCGDSYHFRPARRAFTLADVEGSLDSVELRCDLKRFESDVAEGVKWTIPDDWGDCTVKVSGEPGTRFSVLHYPLAAVE